MDGWINQFYSALKYLCNHPQHLILACGIFQE